MGPRPAGRGWAHPLPDVGEWYWTSMGPRPAGRGWLDLHVLTGKGVSVLQWGRDLPVADGLQTVDLRPLLSNFNGAATCRSRMADTAPQAGCPGPDFNGAATCRSRMGPPLEALQDWRQPTSMGPRPAGRGWTKLLNRSGDYSFLLQWGRDLPVADGEAKGAIARDLGNPSMGPRPAGRGWGLRSRCLGLRPATAIRERHVELGGFRSVYRTSSFQSGVLPMGARALLVVWTSPRCSQPYRVTKTGYSPSSPCKVLASRRACISSSRR